MKILEEATGRIPHQLESAWHFILAVSGLALAFAANGGESNGTRWARSAATAWGLTRHDGSSVLDWVSFALVLVALACFAFSLKAIAHKAGALAS
jgi:hypothetical protein